MWYFAWILGLPLAAAFAVLNAMWYELMDDEAKKKKSWAFEWRTAGQHPARQFGKSGTSLASYYSGGICPPV